MSVTFLNVKKSK